MIYEGINSPKSPDGLTGGNPLYRVYNEHIANSDKRFDDYFNLNVGNIVGGLDDARYKELYQGLREKRAKDLDTYFTGMINARNLFEPAISYYTNRGYDNNSKKTLHRIGDRYKYGN